MGSDKRIELMGKYIFKDDPVNISSWTDEEFNGFAEEYRNLADVMELDLTIKLRNGKKTYRTYLPLSRWSFYFAAQLLWYYDSVVISDPIYSIISDNTLSFEGKKQLLNDVWLTVVQFKDALNEEYLYLTTNNASLYENPRFLAAAESLFSDPKLVKVFEDSTGIFAKPALHDKAQGLKQLMVIYPGHIAETKTLGMYIPQDCIDNGTLGNSVMYDFVTPMTRITKSELEQMGRGEMLSGRRTEYLKDIQIILSSMCAADQLGIPSLIYRDADEAVVQTWLKQQHNSNQPPATRSAAPIFDCALPYMEYIPPDRLLDLRNEIPDAFKEFRFLLEETYAEATRRGLRGQEAQEYFEQKVASLVRKLDTEMNNTMRKVKFLGLAAGSTFTGAMLLFPQSPELAQIISTVIGSVGLSAGIKLTVDFRNETDAMKLNPMYYAWRAKRE